jgi:hypothetical protein
MGIAGEIPGSGLMCPAALGSVGGGGPEQYLSTQSRAVTARLPHTKQSSHCSVAFTVLECLQVTDHNHVTMYGQSVLVCVMAVAAFCGAGS